MLFLSRSRRSTGGAIFLGRAEAVNPRIVRVSRVDLISAPDYAQGHVDGDEGRRAGDLVGFLEGPHSAPRRGGARRGAVGPARASSPRIRSEPRNAIPAACAHEGPRMAPMRERPQGRAARAEGVFVDPSRAQGSGLAAPTSYGVVPRGRRRQAEVLGLNPCGEGKPTEGCPRALGPPSPHRIDGIKGRGAAKSACEFDLAEALFGRVFDPVLCRHIQPRTRFHCAPTRHERPDSTAAEGRA